MPSANPMSIVADPMRRELLRLVWAEERSVNELVEAFDVSQPAISFHLRVLRENDLVHVRRDGRKRMYQANRAGLAGLETYLETYWSDRLSRLKDAAELEARHQRRNA